MLGAGLWVMPLEVSVPVVILLLVQVKFLVGRYQDYHSVCTTGLLDPNCRRTGQRMHFCCPSDLSASTHPHTAIKCTLPWHCLLTQIKKQRKRCELDVVKKNKKKIFLFIYFISVITGEKEKKWLLYSHGKKKHTVLQFYIFIYLNFY